MERIRKRAMLLAASSTVILAPVFADTGNAKLVADALFRGKVDCADGLKSKDPDHPFDAIVIPGGGSAREPDGNTIPSKAGQIRLKAGARVYLAGHAPTIILLDGAAGPEEEPSINKKYLQRQLDDSARLIPNGVILEEHDSLNTATNMEKLAEIVKKEDISLVVIVSSASHVSRATVLACTNGVKASSIPAEDILIKQDPKEESAIHQMNSSTKMLITNLKEKLETLLLLWDPQGKIPTFLSKNFIY